MFFSGREQEYRLFPSALMTRAIDWVAVRADGGVEVSSAAAKTLRFGLPMIVMRRRIRRTVSVAVIAVGL